jgi:hypothetical protein
MASDSGNVTQISPDYLKQLANQLDGILGEVNDQLKGIGGSTSSNTTQWIPPVNSSLTVSAGSKSFDAAAALDQALGAMGGSVNSQLTWLQKTLNDMINEINTTVNSFGNVDSINSESVTQLINDFQNTIGDMSNTSSSGGSSTGGSSTGGTSTGSGT